MSPVSWDLGGTRSLILESLHVGTYVQDSEAVQDATAPQEPKQVIRGDFPVTFSKPPLLGVVLRAWERSTSVPRSLQGAEDAGPTSR